MMRFRWSALKALTGERDATPEEALAALNKPRFFGLPCAA